MSRDLHALPTPSGDAVLTDVVPALAAALDGSGPAVVPVPEGPLRARILAMADLDEPLERDDVALVCPTSGSTGDPRGVLLTAGALTASAHATLDRLGGPGTWVLAVPVTHIAGLQVLVRSLAAGTEPVCVDLVGGFRPDRMAAAIKALPVSGRRYTALVPTQLSRLLDAGVDLSGFDAVLIGGSGARRELLERARQERVRVITTYGMTETSGGCVYDGVPLPGVEVTVGDDGRIWIGGPTIFAGYRGQPDLTRRTLVHGSHLTGDAGLLHPDGTLEVLGRIDDMLITGGENVAPAVVEAALLTHPDVRDVVVVGLPDDEWGSRIAALVVAGDSSAPPTLDELRAHVADTLPSYAAPRALAFTVAVPMLPSGKPDRQAALRAFSA